MNSGPAGGTRLYPNFGAEEQRDAKRAVPELLRLLALWRGLFPPGTAIDLPPETFPPGTALPNVATGQSTGPPSGDTARSAELPPDATAQSTGPPSGDTARSASLPTLAAPAPKPTHEPVNPEVASAYETISARFASLVGLVAWYPDTAAGRRADELSLPPATASAEVVRDLHDKAFCARIASVHSPSDFTDRVRVLDPEPLRSPRAGDEVLAMLASWPESWRTRFVLKPRFGTSGRGRVHGDLTSRPVGVSPRPDSGSSGVPESLDPAVLRALPRLADRGGALLEPWVTRTADLSAQFWVGSGGDVSCLGATSQVLGENGIYLGNRGTFLRSREGELRVGSGHPMESRFLADCEPLMRAVSDAGFRGPCGVDAFAYLDPEGRERLRSLVEFNARFTVGTVALGWLERVAASARSGEWWFAFSPAYARKLRGGEGAPSSEDGWELHPLGEGPDAALVAIR